MTLSIITPAYNPGKLIYETYKSLEEQTFRDFEWIIIDDCSNEENKIILKEIQNKSSFSILIITNEINLKQAKSKNIGLKNSNGKYIKFLDADDLLDNKHLENQLKLINKQKDEDYAVYSPTVNFTDSVTNGVKNNSYLDVESDNISQLNRFLVYPFFSHCSCLFHKKSLLSISGFNQNLITDEDGDLIIKLMLNNTLFIVEENSSYFYRQHHTNNRVSINNSDAKWLARLDVCLTIEDSLIGKYIVSKEALAQRLDVIGLSCFQYSEDLANRFFNNANRIFPNYSKPGNFFPKLIRSLFGIPGYYFLKRIMK